MAGEPETAGQWLARVSGESLLPDLSTQISSSPVTAALLLDLHERVAELEAWRAS